MTTINDIQDEIWTEVDNSADLQATAILTQKEKASLTDVTSTSRVSFFRLWVFVVATVIWARQQLWETLKQDIEDRTSVTRPFTKGWFIQQTLNYQHGQTLPESGIYDNAGLTIKEVEEKKIVARSAVEEKIISGIGTLRIKAARLVDDELERLTGSQLSGLQAYWDKMTAAGISVVCSSDDADLLKVKVDIYFKPDLLSATGKRLDGADDTPVITALNSYLKAKNVNDFDGEISLNDLENVMEAVEGVHSAFITLANSKYGIGSVYDTVNADRYSGTITDFRKPNSGYFKLDIPECEFNYTAKV